jgi:hypothetical protein
MSGRSRRRSNRSAWKRWPRSWPGVDGPVSELALTGCGRPARKARRNGKWCPFIFPRAEGEKRAALKIGTQVQVVCGLPIFMLDGAVRGMRTDTCSPADLGRLGAVLAPI